MTKEKELLKRAHEGDTSAMISLGSCCLYEDYDIELAFYWYEKALENFDKEALIHIATLYHELDIDKAKAKSCEDILQVQLSEDTIRWYERALDFYLEDYTTNYKHACLAAELVSGDFCFKKDDDLAFKLYKYVADQKANTHEEKIYIKEAQAKLANMYQYGIGCDVDKKLSVEYFLKSNYSKEKLYNIQYKRASNKQCAE